MNTTPNIPTEPPTREGADAENIHIAIAFWIPRYLRHLALRDFKSPLALLLLVHCLKHGLRRDGLLMGEVGAAGDLSDGLIRFTATNQAAAVALIEQMPGDLLAGFATIASFDPRNDAWRIHQHGLHIVQFDEFLSENRNASRQRITDRFIQRTRQQPSPFLSFVIRTAYALWILGAALLRRIFGR